MSLEFKFSCTWDHIDNVDGNNIINIIIIFYLKENHLLKFSMYLDISHLPINWLQTGRLKICWDQWIQPNETLWIIKPPWYLQYFFKILVQLYFNPIHNDWKSVIAVFSFSIYLYQPQFDCENSLRIEEYKSATE